MTQQEFVVWADRHGFAPLRTDAREALVLVLQGHKVRSLTLNKETTGKDGVKQATRVKMTDRSVRYEIRGDMSGEWRRYKSGYLSKLHVAPDDTLAGLTRKGC